MKIKKKSIKQLNQELNTAKDISEQRRQIINNLDKENRELRDKLQQRLDDRQLEQRNKLASSLGQMIEATSKAVMYIIGKEVL